MVYYREDLLKEEHAPFGKTENGKKSEVARTWGRREFISF
jgi:hypothetical protein